MVCVSYFGEFSGHDRNEFFVVDSSITIFIGIVDHLINLSSWEGLANAWGDFLEVFWAEAAGSVGVKGFVEGLERGFGIAISTKSEDLKEEGEIDLLGTSCVLDNGEDLLGLCFESEGSDCGGEFLGRDVSTVIVVEDVEAFL